MESKKDKYDTNPLDPDVARHTEEVWGNEDSGPSTSEFKGETRRVAEPLPEPRSNLHSEAPTRRYDSSYPSVNVPPTYAPPAEVYQPPPAATPRYQTAIAGKPTSRTVEGLGIPEKWLMVLPYAPIYIGLVAAIAELLVVPRKETRVRGHASQALALQITIIAIHQIFRLITLATGSSVGGALFSLAAFIFLIISMIRVAQGETHRIAVLSEPADWLNKHIDPRR